MQLDGANPSATVFGEETQQGTSNYFVGNDPEQWRTQIANYGKVRYKQVYDGVDLVYYGNQRKLEYDFIIQPGADYRQIRLKIQGADNVAIDNEGNLVLHMKDGDVVQHAPIIYQTDAQPANSRATISGRYMILADNMVGFEVDNYDPFRPLVIDPVLSYSTYLGGSSGDYGQGIAVDSSGNVYVTGRTASTNFPTKAGAYQTTGTTGGSAFVAKLNPSLSGSASLIYSTYLGGSDDDRGQGIVVDSSGNAYITGQTSSTNFPTTAGAYQTTIGGISNAFVAKLNSTGSALVYSTYLGGNNGSGSGDIGSSIAVDSSGNAYLTGETSSTNFPTTAGAYQTTYGGHINDVFVTKLNSTGTALIYSTYLGGNSEERGYGIAVDSSGNIYITGIAGSFPTTAGAYQTTHSSIEAFVAKLNPSLSGSASLIYSTYLGGSNDDYGRSIAVDSSGNAYIVGDTISIDFPTTSNAFQPTGVGDAFVTKLNSSGTALVYSTYLGGSGTDSGRGIVVDSSGNAYITGYTISTNFPTTTGAYQTTYGGGTNVGDTFVVKLNSSGSALIYSTFIGGSDLDQGYGIAVDSSGNAYITGATTSSNFPTTTYQITNNGTYDAFVVKLGFSSSTTTSVTSSLNPSTSGASVTFTATVSGSTPTGTVTFMDGSTTLGTGALSNGAATYATSALSAGTHSITAVYGGDTNNAGSTSSVLTQTVTAVITSTTTSISSSSNPSASGASVTFTATVTGSSPTGTVTFKDGATTLGTGTLLNGSTIFTTSALSVGSHSITSVYGGDANNTSATSSALIQTVTAPATTTTTTLTSSLNPSAYGASVTFTATVTGSSPTGTVTFKDGAVTSTVSLTGGNAIFITSGLSVGNHSITAVYGGDANNITSTSSVLTQTVTGATTTTSVTSSVNPCRTSNSVTFIATVTGNGAIPTGTVTFKDGTTILGTGTLSNGTASHIASDGLDTGTHPITAVYGGDANYSGSTSSILTQTVVTSTRAATASNTSVTSSSSLGISAFGRAVTFTATVTGSNSTPPTGAVIFKDGEGTIGTGTLSNGTASYTTSTLNAGTHTITAVYGGDIDNLSSTSAGLTYTITPLTTSSRGSYTGTYSGQGMTLHLLQSSNVLEGTFSTSNLSGNLGGFVDSAGRAYVWAWWDHATARHSGCLAGRLNVEGSDGDFDFGGGHGGGHEGSSERMGEVNVRGMTQGPLSGSTVVTNRSASSANYSGTYTATGLTINLTQSSTTLSGTFTAGNLSGTMGGFVDSVGRACVWAWWDGSIFSGGSGVVAGKLTTAGNHGVFHFGGGHESVGGKVDELLLGGMTRR